jgi:hypothetical protein
MFAHDGGQFRNGQTIVNQNLLRSVIHELDFQHAVLLLIYKKILPESERSRFQNNKDEKKKKSAELNDLPLFSSHSIKESSAVRAIDPFSVWNRREGRKDHDRTFS